jgi:hypothetical protein
MKFLRVVVTTLFLIIVQAWADCTGEICCSYPNQGVGCDTVANCQHYGGSIINTCSTQCNCDGSIELAALKLISQNCTEVGMDKAGSPVCLATELSTSLRKSPAPVPEVSTVAFKLLPQDVSLGCPPFMHEVWSPTGLICVMNQLTVEQVAAVHVMAPTAPLFCYTCYFPDHICVLLKGNLRGEGWHPCCWVLQRRRMLIVDAQASSSIQPERDPSLSALYRDVHQALGLSLR